MKSSVPQSLRVSLDPSHGDHEQAVRGPLGTTVCTPPKTPGIFNIVNRSIQVVIMKSNGNNNC